MEFAHKKFIIIIIIIIIISIIIIIINTMVKYHLYQILITIALAMLQLSNYLYSHYYLTCKAVWEVNRSLSISGNKLEWAC